MGAALEVFGQAPVSGPDDSDLTIFIQGGVGDDVIVAGMAGANNYVGDNGSDTLDYSDASGQVISDLALGTSANDGTGSVDTFTSIENLIGGSSNDFLQGNAGANRLDGKDGNDTIGGAGGDDRLIGGPGNDLMVGNSGNDTAVFSGNRAAYTITRNQPAGEFNVVGPDGSDRVAGVELLRFADSTTVLASLASDAGIVNGFSAYRYLAGNLDLLAFYGANPEGGTLHFINWGFAEGRGFTGFNAFRYLAANPELLAALGPNVDAAAQQYVQSGFSQGRGFGFDGYRYLASNPDLLPVFGPNVTPRSSSRSIG